MKLTKEQIIWLDQHGGRDANDVEVDSRGEYYVPMGDGDGGTMKIYLPKNYLNCDVKNITFGGIRLEEWKYKNYVCHIATQYTNRKYAKIYAIKLEGEKENKSDAKHLITTAKDYFMVYRDIELELNCELNDTMSSIIKNLKIKE